MSVEITSVRLPRSAERSAVAAATLVFPTPPFPVYTMIRVALVIDPSIGLTTVDTSSTRPCVNRAIRSIRRCGGTRREEDVSPLSQREAEGVELVGLRVLRPVPKANDIERHVREPLEVGRFVNPLCEMLREIQMALDHLAVAIAAVCAKRRPDRDAARAA